MNEKQELNNKCLCQLHDLSWILTTHYTKKYRNAACCFCIHYWAKLRETKKKVTFTSGPPGGLCGPSTGHQPPVEELFFFFLISHVHYILLLYHFTLWFSALGSREIQIGSPNNEHDQKLFLVARNVWRQYGVTSQKRSGTSVLTFNKTNYTQLQYNPETWAHVPLMVKLQRVRRVRLPDVFLKICVAYRQLANQVLTRALPGLMDRGLPVRRSSSDRWDVVWSSADDCHSLECSCYQSSL